jgi:TolB-like protein
MNKYAQHITPELIRHQLHLLTSCEEIRKSNVLAKFLVFIVEEQLAGHIDNIKEYTIGVKALGRASDFNPQLDAIVRIHAGRLRRAIYEYYQGSGINDRLIINIPKGSYVPVFEFRTPESGTAFGQMSPTNSLVSAAENYLEKDLHHKPRLAVLPFHNLSSDDSKNYFADGFGEQLCIDLARFQNLSIISYYSTREYIPEVKNLRDLHVAIGLDYVLTGSVRFLDNSVRMNIQLIQAETAVVIWAETYFRDLTSSNIFEIQENVADQVLNTIADDNGIITKMDIAASSPSRKTENLSVQEAIYRYYDYHHNYTLEKYHKALAALKNAVNIEPSNPLPPAMLAELYLNTYLIEVESTDELLSEALGLSKKAIELDEYCQFAHKSFAWSLLLSGKREAALEAMEYCINLNPKASRAISYMGLGLICLGELNRGFNLLTRSSQLQSTLTLISKLGFTLYYYHQKKYDDSLIWATRLGGEEMPIIALLNKAILGKMYGSKNHDFKVDPKVVKYANPLISRLILDNDMKNELIDGLRLSGLTVK